MRSPTDIRAATRAASIGAAHPRRALNDLAAPSPVAADRLPFGAALLRELGRLAGVAAAMLGVGWLGLSSAPLPTHISPFWPAAGLALAALLRWGPHMALGIALGAFVLALLQGADAPQAALLAFAHLSGPAVAAWLLRRVDFGARLERRRDVACMLAFGALLGPLVSASCGVVALQLRADAIELSTGMAWWCWWGGSAVGALLAGTTLLNLCRPTGRPGRSPRRLGVDGLLFAATLVVTLMLFFGPAGAAPSPWLFVPHLLLGALALHGSAASPAMASTAALLMALLATLATGRAQGPFAGPELLPSLGLLWGYAASAAAMPLLTQALTCEARADRRRWQRALEAAGLGATEWRLDARGLPHGIEEQASPAWVQMIGPLRPDDAAPLAWLDAVHPLERERARTLLSDSCAPGGADDAELVLRLRRPDGDWRTARLRLHVQKRDRQGRARRLLAMLIDVSWQRVAEERQRMSVSLFQHLHEGLVVTDCEHHLIDANPSYCRMLGSTREELADRIAAPLLPTTLRHSGHEPAALEQALLEHGYWQGRVQTERTDGTPCILQLTVSTIPEPEGPLRYRVVTVSDLTQTVRQQQRLERQAHFDALTGLPNHDRFLSLLQQGLALSDREGFGLSICRLDLDQFKRVNAEHGAAVADALLRQVAERLRGALRHAEQWSDIVARLSGDEFALLLRTTDADEAGRAIERLLAALRLPYRLDNELVIELTASIGATQYPQDRSDPETLMRHAGHALYRVKNGGRNDLRFFDTARHLRDEASLLALARTQQALDNGELRLFYQPKVDMKTGEVLGVEALLRWQHPQRGLLAPGHFLPQIERTGLAVHVGDWVIEQALKQSAQWLAAGRRWQVSVNVTARQLQWTDFAQRLQELIARHAEPVASHLNIEVLESAALADIATTHALIERCRAFGVTFSLDDFGTGYSTLTYLQRLPIDRLKIDRSFVQNMLTDAKDRALVEGVVGLARHFGCGVVAEGVESIVHARALLSLGCRLGQGNGIAPAMAVADLEAWVANFATSGWAAQAQPVDGGGSPARLA